MKAIRVHEFGGPEVLKLEDVARSERRARARSSCACAPPASIRSTPTSAPAPTRASRRCPTRPGRTAPAKSRRSAPTSTDFKRRRSRLHLRRRQHRRRRRHLRRAGAAAARRSCIGCRRARRSRRAPRSACRTAPPIARCSSAPTRRPGETVLVHGATGGVGIAAVELAHAHGLTRDRQRRHRRGLQAVREHGADIVVNHRDAGLHRRDHAATGGRGVDLIVEMAAHINLDRDLGLLAQARPRRRRRQPRHGSRSTRGRRWAATRRSSA